MPEKKVLLVENSRTALAGITLLLEQAGYIVEGVRLGTEAIEKLTTTPPPTYLAIIMDLFMPQLNGYEASKLLRDKGIQTPIFAYTASQDPHDKKRALESGMNAFINKSDDLKGLLAALQALPNP